MAHQSSKALERGTESKYRKPIFKKVIMLDDHALCSLGA